MRQLLVLGVMLTLGLVVTAMFGQDGKAVFEAQKCSMCHSVQKASIEAKTKSEKMKGPDLSGIEGDTDALVTYLKGDSEINGAKHKKKVTSSDAETKAMIEWLKSLG